MKKKKLEGFINYIKYKLNNDKQWLERGIVAIFEKQTTVEQRVGASLQSNDVGFNGYDANLMSHYAVKIIRGGHLWGAQYNEARAKMLKYAGQLANIAIQKKTNESTQLELKLK